MKKTAKRIAIVLSIVALLLTMGFVIGCGGDKTDVGLNEKATYKKISATALQVKNSSGNVLFTAGAGKTYIGVEIKIENASGESFSQSSILSLTATVDGSSVTPNVALTSIFGTKGLDGTIEDGESLTGWTACEAPSGWSSLKILYKPFLLDSQRITITISNPDK